MKNVDLDGNISKPGTPEQNNRTPSSGTSCRRFQPLMFDIHSLSPSGEHQRTTGTPPLQLGCSVTQAAYPFCSFHPFPSRTSARSASVGRTTSVVCSDSATSCELEIGRKKHGLPKPQMNRNLSSLKVDESSGCLTEPL